MTHDVLVGLALLMAVVIGPIMVAFAHVAKLLINKLDTSNDTSWGDDVDDRLARLELATFGKIWRGDARNEQQEEPKQ